MTTEMPATTSIGGRALAWSVAAVVGIAGALFVAARVAADGRAGLGVVIATAMVVGFFAFGSIVLNAVARAMPSAALLIAMMTYTLQVVLIGVVFIAVRRSGLVGTDAESAADATWLAVSIIVLTLVWMIATTIVAMRQRIPVYDLGAGAR